MAQGERFKAAIATVDRDKTYGLDEAVKIVKANAKAKFDDVVEIKPYLRYAAQPKG